MTETNETLAPRWPIPATVASGGLAAAGMILLLSGVYVGVGAACVISAVAALVLTLLRIRRVSRATADAWRASQARFRDFAQASSDWFWEQDADLRYSSFADNLNKPDRGLERLIGLTQR